MEPICPAYLHNPAKTKCYGCDHYLDGGLCDHQEFFRCIEFIRMNEPRLSHSSMDTFICPRKFYLGYVAGWEAIEKPLPMRLGSTCSNILDVLHSPNIGKVDIRIQFNPDVDNWTRDPDTGFYPYQLEALLSVMQAYIDLEKHMAKGSTQVKSVWYEPDYPQLTVVLDMLQYEDYIGWEFKYTSRGESYTKFTLQDQLSCYFLAHRKVQRFTVRTILNPVGMLKLGKKETVDTFAERVYQDALARPKAYFNDRSYWRNEFDLDAQKEKIRAIGRMVVRLVEEGQGRMEAFWQNSTPYTCFLQAQNGPAGPCWFLPICESGVVSEGLYRRRK